ncbi:MULTISPECIES: methenyltetrahydromethanopterin cyclohydrolase [unclassified Halanaerobium]|uniref:methenyltetrahydromethanopterin cyclohydrolase n=1 Tax=unclassified Halanaerobium TaxID=2641197 RepID=UPI000DF28841|nr:MULTISPECIES: methenyltetrahydromethanopterin cyclohydrolase [unclassified Halanaerobium]RCW48740.1 methenyltetrahydromethanopterin cyclohydrolase [Halanaerobium sp. MA284_MarDTE_T2]RCW89082.1 methenyltetrahydromethanopterin cyclohydrolase [Halanaerobium sp. DL-01]
MERRLTLNKNAVMLVKKMIKNKEDLNIDVQQMENGVMIIDGGVKTKGGYRAGKYFIEICLGGMGKASFGSFDLQSYQLPSVEVRVDHPLEACMLSQYAGWKVESGDFFAMASGPGRILLKEEELYEEFSEYHENERVPAVIVLESSELPDLEAADYIADKLSTPCDDVYILTAPAESLTGSIQISGRIVETGLHKMHELNFDLRKIESGWGSCPISPVAADNLTAIGRTNDAVLYGGTAYYTVFCEDEEIEDLIDKIPSNSSKDYGESFLKLFKKYNNFYDIDPMLFSPARVIITNRKTGSSFSAGSINYEILKKSFFGGQ